MKKRGKEVGRRSKKKKWEEEEEGRTSGKREREE